MFSKGAVQETRFPFPRCFFALVGKDGVEEQPPPPNVDVRGDWGRDGITQSGGNPPGYRRLSRRLSAGMWGRLTFRSILWKQRLGLRTPETGSSSSRSFLGHSPEHFLLGDLASPRSAHFMPAVATAARPEPSPAYVCETHRAGPPKARVASFGSKRRLADGRGGGAGGSGGSRASLSDCSSSSLLDGL